MDQPAINFLILHERYRSVVLTCVLEFKFVDAEIIKDGPFAWWSNYRMELWRVKF